MEWEQLPGFPRVPHCKRLIEVSGNSMIFDGYFYIDDDELPVQRIYYMDGSYHLVEILEKQKLENTSEYFTDEEGDSICLFPTAILKFKFRTIWTFSSMDDLLQAFERVQENENLKRNSR